MFKKYKFLNLIVRINAFRLIERLERMIILGGQNTESVNILRFYRIHTMKYND